jgi:hypothetical protein
MARKSGNTSHDDSLDWLMKGDPAIRWQTMRDLLGKTDRVYNRERDKVPREGWGARLLKCQDPNGTWAGKLYSPKWTSTTYSLILLRRCGLPAGHPAALKGCRVLIDRGLFPDGGIDLSVGQNRSETCITGFVLALVTQLGLKTDATEKIVDYLLREQMKDGGWNCLRFQGATHSSFHTTINVLEGLRGYVETGGKQTADVLAAEARAREFFLEHRLYRSHRTGDIVNPCFTRFSFPPRWHHDVLRTLDYFQSSNAPYDKRLEDPIELLLCKRKKDGYWLLQNRHPGKSFFEMEAVGKPSRWNTLRALRILKWWGAANENAK